MFRQGNYVLLKHDTRCPVVCEIVYTTIAPFDQEKRGTYMKHNTIRRGRQRGETNCTIHTGCDSGTFLRNTPFPHTSRLCVVYPRCTLVARLALVAALHLINPLGTEVRLGAPTVVVSLPHGQLVACTNAHIPEPRERYVYIIV